MVLHRGARRERHVSRRALASVESILLASADLMLSLESWTPDREHIGLSETAHSLTAARTTAVAVPARTRIPQKQGRAVGRTIAENKSGHPLVLDGPSLQVIVNHLCRKGTSAGIRTDGGGPRFDERGVCLGPVIAWQEGHDVVSGLVRQLNCEVARLYQ